MGKMVAGNEYKSRPELIKDLMAMATLARELTNKGLEQAQQMDTMKKIIESQREHIDALNGELKLASEEANKANDELKTGWLARFFPSVNRARALLLPGVCRHQIVFGCGIDIASETPDQPSSTPSGVAH